MSTTRTPKPAVLALALCVGAAGAALAGGERCAREAEHAKEAAGPVYAVEGDVQKPLRTGGPLPAYPDFGKKERIEGKVVARVLIEKDGTISEAEILESLRDDFDAHALESLRQWTFEPATLDGEPVRVHYNLTVNYRLERDPGKKAETGR